MVIKKAFRKKRQEIKITEGQAITISSEDLSNNDQTTTVTSELLSRRQSQMNQIKQLHKASDLRE
jgi:hypothetical protein